MRGAGVIAGSRWIVAIAGTVAAVILFSFAVHAHLRSACLEQDTPYLPLCADPPEDPAQLRKDLRERIARDPGDSNAWTQLLVNETKDGTDAVLPGAVLAAPNNSNVARWRAAQAMEKGHVDEGIALMVQILRHRGSAETAEVLAQIAATPEGPKLLEPHLSTADEWLPQVLGASAAMKQAPGDLLAVVAAAQEQGKLPDEARRAYMRTLKASGQWLDAYGLWVAQHKELVPLLYNGSFDDPFEADGFDWEFTAAPRSRAGVLLEQEAVARRGLVLDMEFTGRSFTSPIVRQYLFTPPGTYRVRGEYMASKLRSDEGLAWSVQCLSGSKAVAGRTAGLQDTGGVWKPFEVEFTVPPDCGPVASLQLEPAAALEATIGLKGHVAFDAFSLTRALPSQ